MDKNYSRTGMYKLDGTLVKMFLTCMVCYMHKHV